jgi:uncharacterized protein
MTNSRNRIAVGVCACLILLSAGFWRWQYCQEPIHCPPYRTEEVALANGEISLSGTLTLPDPALYPPPYSAAVIISGAGPQDRDGYNGLPIRPSLRLADALTRAGIATLRYDDRGVGGSTGDHDAATSLDFATDAAAAFAYLQNHPQIKANDIGAVGHSEGALIALLMLREGVPLAYLINLAGPTVQGSEVISKQIERRALAAGQPATEATKQAAEALALLNAIAAAGDGVDLAKQFGDWPALWAQAQIPLLAVFGGADVQVDAEQGRVGFLAATEKNPRARVEILAGANHMFLAAQTGSTNEYPSLVQQFVPNLMPLLIDWLRVGRFG